MSTTPVFATTGKHTDDIHVRLSYKIVRLFSEGLYASPNKAIEELVANSFDAGALRVAVFLPPDFHDQGATIAVLDDGEGMDADGLNRHWLIGISNKRSLAVLPKGRNQIGKFGIGKLATYVLSKRLTHISKKDDKFYSTSMDYDRIEERIEEGVEPKTPIKIALRELTEDEAKDSMSAWLSTAAFQKCQIKLFGKSAAPSWTFAVMSELRDKVHEIKRGVLEWVLRTALPLRDDFAIYLDGMRLEPSKAGKGRLKRWVVGKDIVELPRPAPDELTVTVDENQTEDSGKRYGLQHPVLGRITGYAEVYKDLLTTGKSEELGRSSGFFIYVFDRLINVTDGHFGIKPDELRHGTFGRARVVVHMDGLDDFLQSDRERVREGPALATAQNVLRAIFNLIRATLDEHDKGEDSGTKLARKLAGSPSSLARRPIIELARAVLEGNARSRYLSVPPAKTHQERDDAIAQIEQRAENPEEFLTAVKFGFDATTDNGIAVYEAGTGELRINGLHPFVGAFFDEFNSKTAGLPLELFAMAEVLLESHLFQAGFKQDQVDEIMTTRDQLLRYVAQESGRRTSLGVANALRNARNDEDKLEIEVVEAFRSLGFEATRISGKKNPDGVAKAFLSADASGRPRRYSLTLEAKSKQQDGKKVAGQTVDVAVIALHRDNNNCEHAVVVGPSFPTTQGPKCNLAQMIEADRKNTAAKQNPKTITLINIDDLARLVQLRPFKRLGLTRIREMLQQCSLPEECKAWIDAIEKEKVAKPPYVKIVHAIHQLQKEFGMSAVEYAGLRVSLARANPPIKYDNNEDLIELCKAMSQMAPGAIVANDRTVELEQSPENVLELIESATKEHLADEQ